MSEESRGIEETVRWNGKEISKKDLHKKLSEAITSEHENKLRQFAVEDVLEFLDNQLEWKIIEESPSRNTKDGSQNKEDDIELGPLEGEKNEDQEKREEKMSDGGIHEKKEKDVQDYQDTNEVAIEIIKFDYSKLIGKSTNESRPIKLMIDRIPHGKKILKHPVIEAFILMKWYELCYFWYLWVGLKIIFMYLFFNYGGWNVGNLGMRHKRNNCSDIVNISRINETEDISESIETTVTKYFIYAIWGGFVLFEITEILKTLYRTFIQTQKKTTEEQRNREISMFSIIRSIKKYCSIRNILQLVIYFGFTGPLLFIDLECQTAHTLHSLLLPIMGIEILFEFGYHPYFYQYIYMFYRVIKSYFRILLIYMPIIYGFCCSFYEMFPETKEYSIERGSSGFNKMLGKTFVMMLGEIEYMDIPIEDKVWRMLLFLAFLFSMPLVLLNLLNAVAIADVAEMIEEADKEVLYNLLILLEIVEPIPFREVII